MKFSIKEYAWHSLGTCLMTAIFCSVVAVVCLNSDFLDPVSKALDRISFTDTYFYMMNKESDDEVDFCSNIIMIDMHGCESRAAIAHKLDELNAMNPAVIGMDCMFGENSMTGKAEDDSLLHAATRCKSLVTATRVIDHGNGYQIDRSYFAEEAGCDEASINVEDDVFRNFNLELTFDSLKVKTFVGRILERVYPETYEKMMSRGQEDFLINFKGMMFDIAQFDDPLFREDVEGKIVLMGDFEDWRDFHDVPTTAGGDTRINGTIIHAYSIATATQDRMIETMSETSGWILGVILTYIFAFVSSIIFVEFDELSGIATNAIMLLLLVVLFIVGGIIFIKYQYEINLGIAMLGIGAVGTTNEIWFWFCTTKPYLKIQEKMGLPDGGVRRYVNNEDTNK